MCSTLKYGHRTMRVGAVVQGRVWKSDRVVQGKWTGFIREERLKWWREQTDLTPIEVFATSFTQHDVAFDVPGKILLGYQIQAEVYYGNKCIGYPGEIKLITRKSANEYESSIHTRWPVVKTGSQRLMFYFQPWDQIEMPTQLPLFPDGEEAQP